MNPTASAPVAWSDTYLIGIDVIDRQHRHLFDLAQRVCSVADLPALRAALMELYRYVREHFEHEEDLMRRTEYPKYWDHVEMHEQIVDRLNSLSAEVGAGRWDTARLVELMRVWLADHIVSQDTLLADHVRAPAAK